MTGFHALMELRDNVTFDIIRGSGKRADRRNDRTHRGAELVLPLSYAYVNKFISADNVEGQSHNSLELKIISRLATISTKASRTIMILSIRIEIKISHEVLPAGPSPMDIIC